ncbi:uncharacterized protein FRV6_15673 [Fusarium oxysporum]|uniref:Uncharacterized protein n=1 Tax=Fusarium oxysporum TaxID=5507 RepID=A0A2H3TV58_FUSOX|nr:uncharacterized protein FRV6_15673 [Fusarium oxysporum]
MKGSLLLFALVVSFVCLCWGANTGGSTTSPSTANQVTWASDCVDSVVSNYMLVLTNELHRIDTDNVTSPTNTTAEPTTVGTKTNKILASMVLALPCLRGLFRLSLLEWQHEESR